jgi:hypothetical protein
VSTDTDRVAKPATAPVPDAPAAASPADAVMPTSNHLTADDVERTLTQLASLRDRGVIGADEYEARRMDLLGRL